MLVLFSSCENEDMNSFEVDGVLTETLEFSASTDGTSSIQAPAFPFDIELSENSDLSKYEGKVKLYKVDKITWQAENYSGPIGPILFGYLRFGKLSENTPLTSETEIISFTLTSNSSEEFVLNLKESDKITIENMLLKQSGVKAFWTQVVETNTLAGDVRFKATVKIYATLIVE
jgi:hypothetical protein